MKTKAGKIVFLVFALGLVAIIYLSLLFFLSDPISPQSYYQPDLKPLISKKISHIKELKLQTAESLPSLDRIPRYLSYNSINQKVYSAKNSKEKFSPASFTKLLTAQIALDLIPPDQYLTATTQSVNKVPTILGLLPGEQIMVKDLVRASIATSANDAAETLAWGTSSLYGLSVNDFISLMNLKAKKLNMINSRFANPDGLDEQNQYSTLEDMAKLIHNVQQNYPEILKSAMSDNQDIKKTKTNNHYYLPNWNGLLNIYPGVNGLKIAYTQEAGYSTIITAEREGVKITVILSGADSYIERDLAAAALLDHAFAKENIVPANISRSQIKKRYKQWANLAAKIRQESR